MEDSWKSRILPIAQQMARSPAQNTITALFVMNTAPILPMVAKAAFAKRLVTVSLV